MYKRQRIIDSIDIAYVRQYESSLLSQGQSYRFLLDTYYDRRYLKVLVAPRPRTSFTSQLSLREAVIVFLSLFNGKMSNIRPTVIVPDNDPYVQLEDINNKEVLSQVKEENERTLKRFKIVDFRRDRNKLKAALDRPDKFLVIVRRRSLIYNYQTDKAHPRGIQRRTTLERLRAGKEAQEELLDLDVLADAEGEDQFQNEVTTLPPLYDRTILQLSYGRSNAVVLREQDLAAYRFVKGGFALDEVISKVDQLDRDTILLMSTFGRDVQVTRSGKARTVRLQRRSTIVEEAPVLFSVPINYITVTAERNQNAANKRIKFRSFIDTFNKYYYLGSRSGLL